jgi:hypothetical protein
MSGVAQESRPVLPRGCAGAPIAPLAWPLGVSARRGFATGMRGEGAGSQRTSPPFGVIGVGGRTSGSSSRKRRTRRTGSRPSWPQKPSARMGDVRSAGQPTRSERCPPCRRVGVVARREERSSVVDAARLRSTCLRSRRRCCRLNGHVGRRALRNLPRFLCPGAESNRRHADFQSAALPTELPGHPPPLVAGGSHLSRAPRRVNSGPPPW